MKYFFYHDVLGNISQDDSSGFKWLWFKNKCSRRQTFVQYLSLLPKIIKSSEFFFGNISAMSFIRTTLNVLCEVFSFLIYFWKTCCIWKKISELQMKIFRNWFIPVFLFWKFVKGNLLESAFLWSKFNYLKASIFVVLVL